ncbi:glyoxylase I family protein [Marmoricola sp. OAE513]|uniref:VOC family protein n=1 Tax=Marmoricola sp. OAE513 TaxID=2817894 RepID=UPI001AE17E74
MIQGFSHIGIGVSDLERSVRFYSEVFGFAQLYQLDFENNEVAATMEQEGTFKSAMLIRDDVRIELLQWVDVPTSGGGKSPMTRLGFTHLSFRVEEIDDLTEAVVAHGGAVHPQTLSYVGPEGSPQTGLLYYTDPDGTRIEVMTNVPDLSAL